uniref:Zn(2)-C6 fungal-type domain-containing protein n=1 Tax=Bionectria ochroleuca TaxID=29856 RepID=A0A8H7MZT1_BIOOC
MAVSATATMEKPAKSMRVNKRKRVTRACDSCRIRKHRCDGTHPTCSPCFAIHQSCSYGSDNKKRGLPTGYVHALELLWSLVFTVVPNSRSIVKSLMSGIQFSLDSRSRLVMESRYTKDSETLKQAWENSGVQGQLDQLLSGVQEIDAAGRSLAAADKTKSETVDIPPQLSFEAIRSASVVGSDFMQSHNADTPARSRPTTVQAASQTDLGSTTIFTQHLKGLLDAYFSQTHLWLPIVKKYKMLELLYTPPRNRGTERGDMATLWAVLAYSSLQESRGTSTQVEHRASLPTPEQLYAKARQQLPNEEASLPEYAQAFLILSLFKLDKGDVSACWCLIGQAVRICLSLNSPSLSDKELQLEGGDDSHQRRLLLGCFVLDTIVSCQLRKPPHLRTEDVNLSSMLAETGPDEWELQALSLGKSYNMSPTCQPSRAISIFNQYVGVVRILNDVMMDPMTSDRLCIKYLLALSHWHDHLPEHCVISPPPGQGQLESMPRSSPQLVNLHLAFKSTAMVLKAQHGLLSERGLISQQSVKMTGSLIECLMSRCEKDFTAPTGSMPRDFQKLQIHRQ